MVVVVGVPPFTDSTPDQAVAACCVVCVGVAGWNTSAAWFEHVRSVVAGVLGTLLGPEETPVVGVFSGAAPGSAVLTRRCVVCRVGVVVVWGSGCGCVLSVA